MRGFDPIAPFYDALKTMVFFGHLDSLQAKAVRLIPDGSKALVLGGGTGKLLESFGRSEVTYLELSARMIQRAKKRQTSAFVNFVEIDFLEWQSQERFDVVICPFFLDLFPSGQLIEVIHKIHTHLKAGGELLVIDFNGKSKAWVHGGLLRAMFFFFYSIEAIEIRTYNGMFEELSACFGRVVQVDGWMGGFVLVNQYRSLKATGATHPLI